MKIKTSDLTGPALDWAVAEAELELERNEACSRYIDHKGRVMWERGDLSWAFSPSTDGCQGVQIIDREKITVVCAEGDYNQSKAGTPDCYDTYWVATIGRLSADTVYGPQGDDWGTCFQIDADAVHGPTPLVAAMRCYCASKLGDEVEVPDELC